MPFTLPEAPTPLPPPSPGPSTHTPRHLAAWCGTCEWLRPAWLVTQPGGSLTAVCLDCGAALPTFNWHHAQPQAIDDANPPSTVALYLASQPPSADPLLFIHLDQPTEKVFAPVHSQGLRRQLPVWREQWQQLRRWSGLEFWWGAILPVLIFGLALSFLVQQGRQIQHLLPWLLFLAGYPVFMLLLWRVWKNHRADGWLRATFQQWCGGLRSPLTDAQRVAALETVRADCDFTRRVARLPLPAADGLPVAEPPLTAPDRIGCVAALKDTLKLLRLPAASPAAPDDAESAVPIPPVPAACPSAVEPEPPAAAPEPTRVCLPPLPLQDLASFAHSAQHLAPEPEVPPQALRRQRRWRLTARVAVAAFTLAAVLMISNNLRRDVEIFLVNTEDRTVRLYVDDHFRTLLEPHQVDHFFLARAGRHVIELRDLDQSSLWRRAVDLPAGSYALNPSVQTWQFIWHEFQGANNHRVRTLPSDESRAVLHLPGTPDWPPYELQGEAMPPQTGSDSFTWLELRRKGDLPYEVETPTAPPPTGPAFEEDADGNRQF